MAMATTTDTTTTTMAAEQKSRLMTVGELRAALADVPDGTWVCVVLEGLGGIGCNVRKELRANEPYVAISAPAYPL
jgi:hypothetical protein